MMVKGEGKEGKVADSILQLTKLTFAKHNYKQILKLTMFASDFECHPYLVELIYWRIVTPSFELITVAGKSP